MDIYIQTIPTMSKLYRTKWLFFLHHWEPYLSLKHYTLSCLQFIDHLHSPPPQNNHVILNWRWLLCWKYIYRICPNRSACPNRRAPPFSKKQISSNSLKMPNKTSKDHPKHWIRAVFRSVWLPHMRKSPLPCKQRSTRFLFTVYKMCIAGTGRHTLLLKLIDVHPSPCTRTLRFY